MGKKVNSFLAFLLIIYSFEDARLVAGWYLNLLSLRKIQPCLMCREHAINEIPNMSNEFDQMLINFGKRFPLMVGNHN